MGLFANQSTSRLSIGQIMNAVAGALALVSALFMPQPAWAAKKGGAVEVEAQTSKAADFVTVNEVTVREVPPSQPATGMFMTLVNADKRDHALVLAHSAAAKAVELHGHVEEGGMMKMRPVKTIEIKAGGTTELKPGGLHVMLLGLVKPVKEGETVKVTLKFEDASEKTVEAKVVSLVKGSPAPRAH